MECKSILKDTFEYGGARFNRYIVECKYEKIFEDIMEHSDLIDT